MDNIEAPWVGDYYNKYRDLYYGITEDEEEEEDDEQISTVEG